MCGSRSVLAVATVLWLLTVASLSAAEESTLDDPFGASAVNEPQPPPVASESRVRGSEAAIKKALAKPTQLEFIDTPLGDVIDYLKSYHAIEIQLDCRALEDVGIGADTPITKNLKGISLRAGLNLILRDLDLTWTIQDEVLQITTPEEAECRLKTKVLDVADLVVCRDSKGRPWDDYDTLIKMITVTVLPKSWNHAGGPCAIAPANLGTAKALVISQTDHAHDEIAEVLAKVRAIAKKTPDAGPPQRDRPIPRPPVPMAGQAQEQDGGMGKGGMGKGMGMF